MCCLFRKQLFLLLLCFTLLYYLYNVQEYSRLIHFAKRKYVEVLNKMTFENVTENLAKLFSSLSAKGSVNILLARLIRLKDDTRKLC